MITYPQEETVRRSGHSVTMAATAALLVSLVLTLALAVGGCGGSSTTSSPGGETTVTNVGQEAGAQITMKNISYEPATVTINVGGTVTWTNDDSVPHTVAADNDEFSSGTIDPGQSFSFTFATAGTYPYHCTIHPQMTGVVTVQ